MKYKKAWENYHIINNKMLDFLVWDYIKVEGLKLSTKGKQNHKRYFDENFTFERRARKIKKIFERR